MVLEASKDGAHVIWAQQPKSGLLPTTVSVTVETATGFLAVASNVRLDRQLEEALDR